MGGSPYSRLKSRVCAAHSIKKNLLLDYGCPAFANAATTSIDMNAAVTAMVMNTPSIGSSHQCTSLSISKRPLFYFLFRPPGGRNKQGKEKVSPRGARPSGPKTDGSSKRSGMAFAIPFLRLPIIMRSSNVRLSNG